MTRALLLFALMGCGGVYELEPYPESNAPWQTTVEVRPDQGELSVSDSVQMSARVVAPSDWGEATSISWSVLDEEIITVSELGVVRARRPGVGWVRATLTNSRGWMTQGGTSVIVR